MSDPIESRLWGDENLRRFLAWTQDNDLGPLEDVSLSAWRLLDQGRVDVRTKLLAIMAVDVASSSFDALASHTLAARRMGVEFEEIIEVLMAILPYVGLPRGFAAVRTVLSQLRAESSSGEGTQ